jgi:hypothetical protein
VDVPQVDEPVDRGQFELGLGAPSPHRL